MKVEISHHSITDGWKSVKPLVFVGDEPKDTKEVKKEKKGKKKKTASQITSKNFGSYLQPAKAKEAQILCLAWRCRYLGCNSMNATTNMNYMTPSILVPSLAKFKA